jgi:hypothetical protein
MGPANVAPWLEQVADGLAKKVTIGLEAEILEVASDGGRVHYSGLCFKLKGRERGGCPAA